MKIIVSILLSLLSINVFAINHQITQEKVVTDAFHYLNQVWSNKGNALSRDITEKYFDPETTLIINGKKVYRGYAQFDNHFREVGKYIVGQIRFPFLEVISVKDKLIVRFDEDINDKNGTSYPANVMAIFTFHNGKIKEWEEVANTKYFCQAESVNAVYSK